LHRYISQNLSAEVMIAVTALYGRYAGQSLDSYFVLPGLYAVCIILFLIIYFVTMPQESLAWVRALGLILCKTPVTLELTITCDYRRRVIKTDDHRRLSAPKPSLNR
jgi:hypothetical protein